MEISLEALTKLRKEKRVTVTIEDAKGEFALTQTPKSFLIEADGLKLEITRPCGGFEAALTAWQAVSDILGDWPEN